MNLDYLTHGSRVIPILIKIYISDKSLLEIKNCQRSTYSVKICSQKYLIFN